MIFAFFESFVGKVSFFECIHASTFKTFDHLSTEFVWGTLSNCMQMQILNEFLHTNKPPSVWFSKILFWKSFWFPVLLPAHWWCEDQCIIATEIRPCHLSWRWHHRNPESCGSDHRASSSGWERPVATGTDCYTPITVFVHVDPMHRCWRLNYLQYLTVKTYSQKQ